MQAAIEETLHAPEAVVGSSSAPDVHLYYRFVEGTRVGDMYLCAVVKVTEDPFLITAYLTNQPKEGVRIWTAEE